MKHFLRLAIITGVLIAAIFVFWNLELGIFAEDKWKHFLVSLYLFLFILTVRLIIRRHHSVFIAFILAFRDVLVIGIFKEFLDYLGFGDSELGDLIANLVGILLPFLAIALVEFLDLRLESFIDEHSPNRPKLRKLLQEERRFLTRERKMLKKEGISILWRL
jgi:hypothetical protein